MTISETNIKNAALSLVGAAHITSPTDDSKEAKAAKELYPLVVKEIYEYPIEWSFATARAVLTQLAVAPAFGHYSYQYELPPKCCGVLALVDEDGDTTEYEWRTEVYVEVSGNRQIEHNVLLTDQDEAFIKYVRLREDPNSWKAYFSKMVYTRLAFLLCAPLKADKQKRREINSLWHDAVLEAKIGNGMEGADVSSNNVNLDKGNTDVVDAANREGIQKKYIVERE